MAGNSHSGQHRVTKYRKIRLAPVSPRHTLGTDTAVAPPVNPSTLRVRRHRERVHLFTVELPGPFIDAARARGLIDAALLLAQPVEPLHKGREHLTALLSKPLPDLVE